MRMWMVNPDLMCRKHLLGEHGEIHKHRHNFEKGHSIEGRRGQIDPLKMKRRHDVLAEELVKRGFTHASPYEQPDLSGYDLTGHGVDIAESFADLCARCEDCNARRYINMGKYVCPYCNSTRVLVKGERQLCDDCGEFHHDDNDY